MAVRLWKTVRKHHGTPDGIRDTAALLLALWTMGITDEAEIGALLKTRRWRELRRISRELRKSTNADIRRWVAQGLPPGYHYELPYQREIRCPLCKRWIRFVPCPGCVAHVLPDNGPAAEVLHEPPLGIPTSAIPGSLRKVQVLRLRLERGEALFHPGDARIGVTVSVNRQGSHEPEQE